MIQLPSGCMPMISEWACWAICRISVLRYASGIQSRGSIFWSAATTASKYACRAPHRPAGGAGRGQPPVGGLAQRGLGRLDLAERAAPGRRSVRRPKSLPYTAQCYSLRRPA